MLQVWPVRHQLRDCAVNKVSMGTKKIPMASSSVLTPGGIVCASVTDLGSSIG